MQRAVAPAGALLLLGTVMMAPGLVLDETFDWAALNSYWWQPVATGQSSVSIRVVEPSGVPVASMAREGNTGHDRYLSSIGGGGFWISTTDTSGEMVLQRQGSTIITSLDNATHQYTGPVCISFSFGGLPPTAGPVVALNSISIEAPALPDMAPCRDNAGAMDWFPRTSKISVWDDAYETREPEVACNPAHDEYLAVWENHLPNLTDIYARRVHADGYALSWFSVASDTGRTNSQPAVAYSDAQDAYLVAYTYTHGPGDLDIYARRIAWDGSWMGPEFGISTAADKQWNPAVAYNALEDEYLVVYENWWAGGLRDIAAQRVRASDGTLLSWRNLATGSGEQRVVPDVAYNPVSNNYLVAYGKGAGVNGDILGVLVSADMASVSPEIAICANSGDQDFVALAAGPNEYLAAWEDDPSGNGQYSIVARRIDGSGVPQGSSYGIDVSPRGDLNVDADVAYTDARGYLVAWSTYPPDGYSDRDLWARFMAAGTDAAVGGPFPYSTGVRSQGNPALACAPGGPCLVVQEDSWSLYFDLDLEARFIVPMPIRISATHLDSSGNPVVVWDHIGCGWVYTVDMTDALSGTWNHALGAWPVYVPVYTDPSGPGDPARHYRLRAHWVPPDHWVRESAATGLLGRSERSSYIGGTHPSQEMP